ncbi:MAG: hypothetical protein SF069_08840 [Phycisphaerae bacterium]|nr:hypothetical protein [Phycisphaerae bacterium]
MTRTFAVRFAIASLVATPLLAQSADRAVFVSNNGNLEGSVSAFRVTGADQLQLVNRVVTGSRPNTTVDCPGCNAYEISLSPNGRWLASSHPAGNLDGVTIFEVAADGSIAQRAQISLSANIGGPLDLAWLSDDYLAVTRLDTTPDRVAIYQWTPPGTLAFVRTYDNGGGLSYFAVSADGAYLFANDSIADRINIYGNNADGTLIPLGFGQSPGPFPLEIATHPTLPYVYAACGISGSGSDVLAFGQALDGSLSLLSGAPFSSGGSSPSNCFVSGDVGTSSEVRYLIVGHGTDATARTMSINNGTGALAATGFLFDVGLQGTLGDVSALDDLVFVTDNSSATDGLTGIYVFRIGTNGSLTQLGPIVSTGGIAPRSIAVWSPPVVALLGDMNCDGIVSVGDIAGFVLALTDPAAYALQFPNCDINNADINQDSVISVGDIAGFVALLTGG